MTTDETITGEEQPQSLHDQYDLPESWTQEQAEQWVARVNVDEPTRKDDGVFYFDPTRAGKAVQDWCTEELLAYLKGELVDVGQGKRAQLIREYARREPLEAAWSDEEVLAYHREGVVPPKTSSGVWERDVTRRTRKAADWTDAELDAWAKGEIQAVGVVTDAHLAKELHQRFRLPGYDDSVATVIKRYTHQVATPVAEPIPAPTVHAKTAPPPPVAVGALTAANVGFIDGTLAQYAKVMAPGRPISEDTGGAQQRALENLFVYVLRLEGQALLEALERIKHFIHQHREGVFSPSYAYRFVHLLKGERRNQHRHVNLIELFLVVTHPLTAKRQQVDVRLMLAGVPTDKQEALVEYFTRYA